MAWVPAIGGGVDWDLFHKLGRRVFQHVQGVMSHSSLHLVDVFVPVVWINFTQFLKELV